MFVQKYTPAVEISSGSIIVISPASITVVFSIPKNRNPKETTEFKNPYIKTKRKVPLSFGIWIPLIAKIIIAIIVEIPNLYVKNIAVGNPTRVYLITGEATPQIIETKRSIKYE